MTLSVLAERSEANTPDYVEAAQAAFHDNGHPLDVDLINPDVDTENRHFDVDGRLRGHNVNDGN
jgi:hypothetical protein